MKTNTKKARENVRAYIMENFTPENYTDEAPEQFPEIARFILETFRKEKYNRAEDLRYYKSNEVLAFADWCAGLPSVLDTCYFYNRSARKDLGDILEETPEERKKYDEHRAECVLAYLIYNELIRGAKGLQEPTTLY